VARSAAVLADLLLVQHAGLLLRAASGIRDIACPTLNIFLQELSSRRMQTYLGKRNMEGHVLLSSVLK